MKNKEDIEYANGGVNRFMKTAKYVEPTQGFKLDYNQLAAGVLAREDAYDKNAAILDELDQDYIQGITGAESDRAKEINSNISTRISEASDAFGGDLSLSGDHVRATKKYIKQTTGFDSEGALINSNLKGYKANLAYIDELKDYTEEQKDVMRIRALEEHNTKTDASKAGLSGKFSSYADHKAEDFVMVADTALAYAKEMSPTTFQSALREAGIMGKVSADGSGQYNVFRGGKSVKLTKEEIMRAVLPMMRDNEKVMAYLDYTAGNSTFMNNRADTKRGGNRHTENEELQAERQKTLLDLQSDTSKAGVKKLQEWLNENGIDVGIADGVSGKKTIQGALTAAKELSNVYSDEAEQNAYINDKLYSGVGSASGLKVRNDFYVQQQIKANTDYTASRLSAAKKLEANLAVAGIVGGEGTAMNIGDMYKNGKEIKKQLLAKSPEIGETLNSKLDLEIDPSDPNSVTEGLASYNSMTPLDIAEKICPKCIGEDGKVNMVKLNNSDDYQAMNSEMNAYQNQVQAADDIDMFFEKSEGNSNIDFNDLIVDQNLSYRVGAGAYSSFTPTYAKDMVGPMRVAIMSGVPRKDFIATLPDYQQGPWTSGMYASVERIYKKANPEGVDYKDILEEMPGVMWTGNKSLGDGNQTQDMLVSALTSFKSTTMGGKKVHLEDYENEIGFTRGEGEAIMITTPIGGSARFIVKGFIEDSKGDKVAHTYSFTNKETNAFINENLKETLKGNSSEQTKDTAGGIIFGLVPDNTYSEKAALNKLNKEVLILLDIKELN